MRRSALTALASLMLVASDVVVVRAEAPAVIDHVDERVDAATGSDRQRLEFHGWSPDSRYIAYSRHHPPSRLGESEPEADAGPAGAAVASGGGSTVQRMHRKVRGGRITGFGRMVGKDVAAYAVEAGYLQTEAAREALGPRTFRFGDGAEALTLEVEVGRRLAFVVRRDARSVFRHVFDRLYVGFEPTLHPSPDGCQALLVFHLDAGWEVDAAIFTFPLEKRRRGRCAAR